MLVLVFDALICRKIRRDDCRYRSFVTCLLFCYMRDADMNFLVSYELDLACNVIFCILSALR